VALALPALALTWRKSMRWCGGGEPRPLLPLPLPLPLLTPSLALCAATAAA
jgi:hypothetical protein